MADEKKPTLLDTKIPAIPGMESNFFGVGATKTQLKITFGQNWTHDQETAFFAAIIMSHDNARTLADLIEKTILQAEAKG